MILAQNSCRKWRLWGFLELCFKVAIALDKQQVFHIRYFRRLTQKRQVRWRTSMKGTAIRGSSLSWNTWHRAAPLYYNNNNNGTFLILAYLYLHLESLCIVLTIYLLQPVETLKHRTKLKYLLKNQRRLTVFFVTHNEWFARTLAMPQYQWTTHNKSRLSTSVTHHHHHHVGDDHRQDRRQPEHQAEVLDPVLRGVCRPERVGPGGWRGADCLFGVLLLRSSRKQGKRESPSAQQDVKAERVKTSSPFKRNQKMPVFTDG